MVTIKAAEIICPACREMIVIDVKALTPKSATMRVELSPRIEEHLAVCWGNG